DNNLIENSIRPLALGRKNYLFAGSHEGARRAAMLYSFFASCQRLEVNPRAWLREILERIPDHPVNRLDELLPHRWVEAPAKASTEEE
ncbi:transposase domain-containing protein, partial [Neolewinella litorea]